MTAEERMIWVRRYKELPSGNVADAMDELKIRRGSVLGLHPIKADQSRTAGFARTVLQKRREKEWDGVNLAKQGRVIDEKLETGELLVISADGINDASTCGGMLAFRAMIRGAQGLLTDGCLRDVDEMVQMGFHACCYGTAPNKSAYTIETVGSDVPVTIKGVEICPDDMVVMDQTGIVVVPGDSLEAVYERALRIAEKEDWIVRYLQDGKTLREARALAANADITVK